MTSRNEDIQFFRRILWLIYAEEALDSYGKGNYDRKYLHKLKKKVTKQLERSEKNDNFIYDPGPSIL